MPRTKGSKNCVTASTDCDAQIAKLQKDKALLEEGSAKTVAQIERLKTNIKSLRESLKPQKARSSRPKRQSQSWRLRRMPLRRKLPKLLRRSRLKLC